MYKSGDIVEEPYGWAIEILDPNGDVITVLKYVMSAQQRYTPHVEEVLREQADGLLSHLNR